MKDCMRNSLLSMVAGVLMTCLLPLAANAQDWQNENAQNWHTTSTMQGSGSAYSPQVTAVGAVSASEMSSTATPYSPNRLGVRRSKEDNTDPGLTGDTSSPVGDAMVPLMVMAAAMAGVVYLRRRRAIKAAEK